MEEMEKLLRVWIQDQHQCRILLSLMLIQEKAKKPLWRLGEETGQRIRGCISNASHGTRLQSTFTMEKWRGHACKYGSCLGTSWNPWRNYCTVLMTSLVAQMVSVCLQCGRPRFNPWVGKIPWRRKWQSTPILLPGKSHGQRSLVGVAKSRTQLSNFTFKRNRKLMSSGYKVFVWDD